MTYSTLRLCAGRGAFEATPRPRLELDLAALANRFRDRGIPVTDARVMLIVTLSSEVTLSRDGRVLIKSNDPVAAHRAFRELRELAGLPEVDEEPAPAHRLPERLIRP